MKSRIADFTLLIVTFFWGSTFVIVQNAIRVFPVFDFLGVRFTVAGILMLVITISLPNVRKYLYSRSIWMAGFILAIWLFAGYAFQTVGLLYTSPAQSGFITGLSVVLVPIFGLILLRHRPSKGVLVGVLLATLGLFLLSYVRGQGLQFGDVLTFLCAIAFAIQIVFVGHYAKKYHPMPLAAIQIFFVGVLSLLTALLNHSAPKLMTSLWLQPAVISGLVITILFATIIAYFAQLIFQKYTSANHAALIFSAEPVFAALTAYFYAGDTLSLQSVVGCVLILAGMLIAEFMTN